MSWGIVARSSGSSRPGSATAMAMLSTWTSRPTNRRFSMVGLASRCGSAPLGSLLSGVTHDPRDRGSNHLVSGARSLRDERPHTPPARPLRPLRARGSAARGAPAEAPPGATRGLALGARLGALTPAALPSAGRESTGSPRGASLANRPQSGAVERAGAGRRAAGAERALGHATSKDAVHERATAREGRGRRAAVALSRAGVLVSAAPPPGR